MLGREEYIFVIFTCPDVLSKVPRVKEYDGWNELEPISMAVIGLNEVSNWVELKKVMENWDWARVRLEEVRPLPVNKLLKALIEASEVRLGFAKW